MTRGEMLARLARHHGLWDIVVIGGGATGAGIAVDAAARGYSVALLEQSDFGKGTSSRSTKLVHGGVRYLRQGNVSLVREALKERTILRRNAPHVVRDLPLIVPAYTGWERVFYGAGLAAYDLLAGRSGFGRSRWLPRESVLERLPTLRPDGLRGGIEYHDGQFDDARLLINLVETAAEHGAVVLNYAKVTELSTSAGRVDGVVARDEESGSDLQLRARAVVNATGVFADSIRRLAQPNSAPLITHSQGTHVVLDRRFVPGQTALMVPRVGHGRVMFGIPWHGYTILGTTDTPIGEPSIEPQPLPEEIESLLRTAGRFFQQPPRTTDVRSAFTGIRPLVRREATTVTAALSRDHTIVVGPTGLVTVSGGKWTTYRHMAEQTVDRAAHVGQLPYRSCSTEHLRIHGYDSDAARHQLLAGYGADAEAIRALGTKHPELSAPLDPELTCTGAEVIWAARHEMARTVEDVLARRCRALFLNVAAARRMAPAVARLLARELQRDDDWQRRQVEAFEAVAQGFTVASSTETGTAA